jgi:hypothetical protein
MRNIANAHRNRETWPVVLFSRVLLVTAVLVNSVCAAAQTLNENHVSFSRQDDTVPTLVIGFVGGLVHRDDIRRYRLPGVCRQDMATACKAQIFENRRRTQAKKVIVRWWNSLNFSSGAGEQTRQPKIILFGHNWGASAVVYLARELDRESVPVALTVQVDSVRKHGEDDSVIPANVAEAVNFYQSTGLIHGCSEILAVDPPRTRILGNFHFKYQVEPVARRTYAWHDRLFFKGHTSIECDPHLWSEVEALIESRLTPTRPAQAEVAAQLPRHSSCQDPMRSEPALARSGRDALFVNPPPKIQ